MFPDPVHDEFAGWALGFALELTTSFDG